MTKEQRIILKSSSVLLIEDNLELRKKFTEYLSYYVGTIYQATNGLDALTIYEEKLPFFIITDIEMPLMDGLEFIKIIREKNKTIPILILSAYSNKDYLLEAVKLHLVEYLIKPLQLDALIGVLEKIANLLEVNNFSNNIYFGEDYYDPVKKIFTINGKEYRLSKSEMKLIEILLQNRGNVVTKEMIESKMYIFKEMSEAALKNIVFKLRRKIGENKIKTINKLGYMIE